MTDLFLTPVTPIFIHGDRLFWNIALTRNEFSTLPFCGAALSRLGTVQGPGCMVPVESCRQAAATERSTPGHTLVTGQAILETHLYMQSYKLRRIRGRTVLPGPRRGKHSG